MFAVLEIYLRRGYYYPLNIMLLYTLALVRGFAPESSVGGIILSST